MQLLGLEKRSFDILKLFPSNSWLHERRHDREAEGAPLLREYVPKAHRGFESHCLRQILTRYVRFLLFKSELLFVFPTSSPTLVLNRLIIR